MIVVQFGSFLVGIVTILVVLDAIARYTDNDRR